MKARLILLATALCLTAGAALALTTQDVIDTLNAEGYTRVEVKVGPTQIKVEAIRGTEKLEQVIDSASGNVLKSETQAVEPGDNTSPGVQIRNRDRDFVGARGSDDGDGGDSADDHGGRGSDDGDDGDDDNGGDDGGNSGQGGGDSDGDDD